MPVKTITAEIDGKVRRIKADIPDDATAEEIHGAVTQFLSAEQPANVNGKSWMDHASDFVQGLVGDTAKGLYDIAKRVGRGPQSTSDKAAFTALGPLGPLLMDIGKSHVDQARKAKESFGKGDYVESAGHAGAALLPVVGPMAANVGETIGGDTESDREPEIARGLGQAAALIGGPKAVEFAGKTVVPLTGKAIKATADVVTSPGMVRGLKRSSEGIVIGSAMHGNVPGMAAGTAGRIVAAKLEDLGRRRAASVEAGKAVDTPGSGPRSAAPGVNIPVEGPESGVLQPSSGKPASSGQGNRGTLQDSNTPNQLEAEIQSATPQEIAKMAPVDAVKTIEATRRGKGIIQAVKDSQKLIDKLADWEFTPDEAKSLNDAGWSKLAHDAGVPVPTGAALKTMKARVWMGLANKLAGPIKTRGEMMNELRASMPQE